MLSFSWFVTRTYRRSSLTSVLAEDDLLEADVLEAGLGALEPNLEPPGRGEGSRGLNIPTVLAFMTSEAE